MGTELALGAATGVFTSVAICPMEVLKVRLQVQVPAPTWTSEAFHVLGSDGVGGLFRGIGALMLRDVPFNALFYGCYESICTAMMQLRGLQRKDELGTPYVFVSGGLAGCIGWSVIMPFDVAKTRLQSGAASGSLAPAREEHEHPCHVRQEGRPL